MAYKNTQLQVVIGPIYENHFRRRSLNLCRRKIHPHVKKSLVKKNPPATTLCAAPSPPPLQPNLGLRFWEGVGGEGSLIIVSHHHFPPSSGRIWERGGRGREGGGGGELLLRRRLQWPPLMSLTHLLWPNLGVREGGREGTVACGDRRCRHFPPPAVSRSGEERRGGKHRHLLWLLPRPSPPLVESGAEGRVTLPLPYPTVAVVALLSSGWMVDGEVRSGVECVVRESATPRNSLTRISS